MKKFLILVLAAGMLFACHSKNPQKAHYIKLDGIDQLNKGKFEKALKLFDEALTYNEDDAEIYYWKGNTLYNLKRQDEALEQYSIAIQKNQAYGQAYENRGRIYQGRGEREKACKDFLQAEKLGINTLTEYTKFCK